MTEERKYAILFAATLLCARKITPTLEEDSHHMGHEFNLKLHIGRAIDRAAQILDAIDKKWPDPKK